MAESCVLDAKIAVGDKTESKLETEDDSDRHERKRKIPLVKLEALLETLAEPEDAGGLPSEAFVARANLEGLFSDNSSEEGEVDSSDDASSASSISDEEEQEMAEISRKEWIAVARSKGYSSKAWREVAAIYRGDQ